MSFYRQDKESRRVEGIPESMIHQYLEPIVADTDATVKELKQGKHLYTPSYVYGYGKVGGIRNDVCTGIF